MFVDGFRGTTSQLDVYPTGSHEVCYGFVDGLFSPICQTVNLTAGNQTPLSGTYVTDPRNPARRVDRPHMGRAHRWSRG